jgi:hypothetical protein
MSRLKITAKLSLNSEQAKLFRIYKRYNECRMDARAAKNAFMDGPMDFYGTNTDNPDLPELRALDYDKL